MSRGILLKILHHRRTKIRDVQTGTIFPTTPPEPRLNLGTNPGANVPSPSRIRTGVRPLWWPGARSIRRFSSMPPCLGGEGWSGGLGRSPLWGTKTWASLDRFFGAQAPRRTLTGWASSAPRLKRATKAAVARSQTIHFPLKRPSRRCAGS
jgi:hypothetical protein